MIHARFSGLVNRPLVVAITEIHAECSCSPVPFLDGIIPGVYDFTLNKKNIFTAIVIEFFFLGPNFSPRPMGQKESMGMAIGGSSQWRSTMNLRYGSLFYKFPCRSLAGAERARNAQNLSQLLNEEFLM